MIYIADKRHEAAGQAIIFVAFMIAALIGMAGLAIDGGEIYLAQRRAQNAVDAALLNAGYTLCTTGPGEDVVLAGYEAAAANEFTQDGDEDQRITINNPPTLGQFAGNTDYVEAIVEITAPTHLIQVIYKGATEISLHGVVQCANPGGHDIVPFPNATIVTLDETDNKAFNGVGNSDLHFCGGGVWSNGGGYSGGSTDISMFTIDEAYGTGDTVPGHAFGSVIDLPYSDFPEGGCTNPSFYSAGDWGGNFRLDEEFVVTSNTGVTAPDPIALIDPPARPATCAPAITEGGEYTITGTECYYGLDPRNHTTVTIGGAEGHDDNVLYIDGDISTPTHGSVIINNVLVYVTGTVDFKADTTVMAAYTDGPWDGFAMWIEGGGWGLSTEAHAINHLKGTFYVPNGDAKINGRSGSVWEVQLIAKTVRYNGCSGNIFIYDPDAFYTIPVQPSLSIME